MTAIVGDSRFQGYDGEPDYDAADDAREPEFLVLTGRPRRRIDLKEAAGGPYPAAA